MINLLHHFSEHQLLSDVAHHHESGHHQYGLHATNISHHLHYVVDLSVVGVLIRV